jgi:predicted ribosomally synthesized peptide with nif11-like leader
LDWKGFDMSASELDRFSADLKSDGALRDQFAEKSNDLGAIVESAQAKGYDFTLDDVQGRLADHDGELSEEALDAVSGGRRSSFTVFVADTGGKGSIFVHW